MWVCLFVETICRNIDPPTPWKSNKSPIQINPTTSLSKLVVNLKNTTNIFVYKSRTLLVNSAFTNAPYCWRSLKNGKFANAWSNSLSNWGRNAIDDQNTFEGALARHSHNWTSELAFDVHSVMLRESQRMEGRLIGGHDLANCSSWNWYGWLG